MVAGLSGDNEALHGPPSLLESLPAEVLIGIINYLCGIDQILLALSCKALARAVQASMTPKFANIDCYSPHPRHPAYNLFPVPANGWRFPSLSAVLYDLPEDAPPARNRDLSKRVGTWMGTGFAFCTTCHKYRTLDETWWRAFAEYESPGITQAECAKDKKLKKMIDKWLYSQYAHGLEINKIETGFLISRDCPAHAFFAERKGKRTL